ncbi:Gfo/Idh/MocA family protein [Mangrovibacterium lignilyticum]|uniref:Gfo/Idh/MocA family protein n=1 Tax=Mangrovibacterium lignilyticum TaxID=2668052 RepID=UPI0013D3CD6B|nr:Gfo/Idh/MocA family oxidoreductase [Mangrovibacterium lignilyticum]
MNTKTKPEKSRREFLKDLAMGGSSLFLLSAPWLQSFAEDKPVSLSLSDQLSIAVIGTGSRGTLLLTILLKIRETANIRIVAICDNYQPNLQYAQAVCRKNMCEVKTYSDYRELLEQEKLDGVVIATPLTEHAAITMDCLSAGIHTFCEKAMARTPDDVKRMYDAHKSSGKILQIGHQRMFNPIYLEGMRRIKDGEIGQVTQMRAYWHRNNNWRRPLPDNNFDLERQINWRLYKDLSVGLLTELMTHQLQVALWVTGKVPVSVIGTGSNVFWKDGRTVPDSVSLTYTFPDGVQFVYDSMTSNKKYGLEEQILGSKGTIEFEANRFYTEVPPPAPGIRQLINNIEHGIFDNIPIGGESWVPERAVEYKGEELMPEDFYEDSMLQMEAFANFIRQGKIPHRMVEEAYYTSLWTLLGENAIDEERKISMPDHYRI